MVRGFMITGLCGSRQPPVAGSLEDPYRPALNNYALGWEMVWRVKEGAHA
jgi:hypothetical protein